MLYLVKAVVEIDLAIEVEASSEEEAREKAEAAALNGYQSDGALAGSKPERGVWYENGAGDWRITEDLHT